MSNTFVIKALESNFKKRNIEVLWFNTFENIKTYLLNQIPDSSTVGIGNSQTLKHMEITKALTHKGNTVYDKTFGSTQEEIKDIKRKSLLTDCYISSSNAVSIDGKIVNIDHSGNRVAAITYGPDKVYLVIGKNKITTTYEDALHRVRNISAPLNAKRAGYNPPCISVGHCVDCVSPERVCFSLSTLEGSYIKGRITLLIANEEDGF
ncbi:MAG: lactate utilization protein [Defluviitaleaceae bacterium]|nr:lactate utilization protein [Defluviitaleaceae bacterium]